MKTKINFEEISFGIISNVGEAKYQALEAFKLAKDKGDTKGALKLINDANKLIDEAGKLHMDVITEEAGGIQHNFSVLFMHAEDQFLTTQTLVLTIKLMIEMMEKYETKK